MALPIESDNVIQCCVSAETGGCFDVGTLELKGYSLVSDEDLKRFDRSVPLKQLKALDRIIDAEGDPIERQALEEYCVRLKNYVQKLRICSEEEWW